MTDRHSTQQKKEKFFKLLGINDSYLTVDDLFSKELEDITARDVIKLQLYYGDKAAEYFFDVMDGTAFTPLYELMREIDEN